MTHFTNSTPALADDPRFASNRLRVKNRDVLVTTISGVLEGTGADEWYRRLIAVGVPAGPINNMQEALAFAESLGLDTTTAVPGSHTPQVVNPISLPVTPPTYRSGPPRMGGSEEF